MITIRTLSLRVLLFAAAFVVLNHQAAAHQLWIENNPNAQAGKSHKIEVCFGHSGSRSTGESLQRQQSKVLSRVAQPGGEVADLETSLQDDHFSAATTPKSPGYYTFGSEIQVGILPQEFHGIPANTRIIMYGKTSTHVAGSDKGLSNPVGFDLELVPLTPSSELQQGGVARAKLLFKGKPLGGENVEISLSTAGMPPQPEHARIQSHEWTIDAIPDPYTGEVAFPLISGGKHSFFIRYTDETPGTYNGPRNDESDFSHLRKGDTYERTLYMSTLTIWVKGK